MYNQYKRKYSKEDIIEIYKNCKTKTEFLCKKLQKSVKFYNLESEIDCYFSTIREKSENERKKVIIDEINKNIPDYSSISEFRKNKPKLYYYWNLWKLPSPYIRQKFSTQEEVLSQIIEYVFNKKCIRNSRKIIKGKELDIYIPELHVALEYNGWFWHKNRLIEDDDKRILCNKEGITLITIREPCNNFYSDLDVFIKEVKQILHKNFNLNLEEKIRLNNYKIDHSKLWKSCFGETQINDLISSCNRYSEVKTKHNRIWQYLLRNNLLHLLQPIKDRDYIYMPKEKFIAHVIKTFSDYSQFVKHKIYQLASKRGYIKDIKQAYCHTSL